ncbi:MAG: PQQ-binding-like beta-propeller repeat protein, partial [Chloroflexi bacterium]|nr:PQQ-binding-like beta-propeller repeat protein [Chloroflexota bacterium]
MVGDTEGGVYAFHGRSGAAVWERRGVHEGGVLSMAVHPGGSAFATAGQDGRVLIWNAAEGRVIRAIDVGGGWVENVAWSQDGQRLAASCSRQVRAYDVDGAEVWRSEDHPSTVSAIAWSSAGELATACYGRATFFDASTGELRQKLEWQGSLVSLVLSPDGGVVACGSQDNTVHFWRRST